MRFHKPLLRPLALLLSLAILCSTLPIPSSIHTSPSNTCENFNKTEATALDLFFYNSAMPPATSSIFSSSNAMGPDFTAKLRNMTLSEADFVSPEWRARVSEYDEKQNEAYDRWKVACGRHIMASQKEALGEIEISEAAWEVEDTDGLGEGCQMFPEFTGSLEQSMMVSEDCIAYLVELAEMEALKELG